MKVRIRRRRPGVPLPEYQTPGSAAFDLAASERVTVAPGEVRLVPTGLVIEVPIGMFLGIFARSSTPVKKGLMVANGVGLDTPASTVRLLDALRERGYDVGDLPDDGDALMHTLIAAGGQDPDQLIQGQGAQIVVANGVGVVDSDYCGPDDEVKISVVNVTQAPVTVNPGDRLAQGILLPAPRIEWEEAVELRAASRGGFGRTGR